MIYHGLPVIPEDDVLDVFLLNSNVVHPNHPLHRSSHHKTRTTGTNNTTAVSSSSSLLPFGYVAILRNDTILLEVGRSVFEIDEDSEDDDSYSHDEVNSLSCALLDATILGLLRLLPTTGWDRFRCNDDAYDHRDVGWSGLRFHCYDHHDDNDEEKTNSDDCQRKRLLSKSITTTWSFCVVYRSSSFDTSSNRPSQPQLFEELTIQQWMLEHLVQFTKLFRHNDVVWRSGTTLSCQYVFAPVIQQRMMILQEQSTTSKRDDDTGAALNWMDMANEIIEQNHELLSKTNVSTLSPTSRDIFDAPPFVSDDDDDDDSYEQQRLQKSFDVVDGNENDSPEYIDAEVLSSSSTSDDDEGEEDELLLLGTPVRTGALPMNYHFNNNNLTQGCDGDDNNISYLDRIVASTTSIWAKQYSDVCDKSFLNIAPIVPINSDDHLHAKVTKADVITDPIEEEDDDDAIPLICFVGDQVDARHSDLWKRSPKSITKAVAMGITNREVVTLPSQQSSTISPNAAKSSLGPPPPPPPAVLDGRLPISSNQWWEEFAKRTTLPLCLLWKNVSTNRPVHHKNSDIGDRNNNDYDRPCFWCERIFPSKASAMQ